VVGFHVFTAPAEQPSVQSGILDEVDDLDDSRQNLLELLGEGSRSKRLFVDQIVCQLHSQILLLDECNKLPPWAKGLWSKRRQVKTATGQNGDTEKRQKWLYSKRRQTQTTPTVL